MKHLIRFSALLVLIALIVVGPALTAFAQGGTNPLCNGLTDADCQILTGASANAGTVTSFRVPNWSISLNFNAGTDSGSFNASGSGELMIPADLNDPALTGLLLHLMIDQASVNSGSTNQSGSGEVIVQGKMAYVNYNGQWYGGELTEEDLASIRDSVGNAGAGMGSGGGADLGALGIDLTGVVTTTRNADATTADGANVADFSTSIDIGALLTSLFSSPALGSLLGSQGMDTTQMTPEDVQMLSAMLTPMFAGTTITVGQQVGVDDNLLHQIRLDVNLNLDASMIDPSVGTITGEFHFLSDIANHNESFTVTPPTDYQPLEDLQAQLDAAM